MINKPIIARWQKNSPWKEFYQIEQDLVISRILIEIFSDDFLREILLFVEVLLYTNYTYILLQDIRRI